MVQHLTFMIFVHPLDLLHGLLVKNLCWRGFQKWIHSRQLVRRNWEQINGKVLRNWDSQNLRSFYKGLLELYFSGDPDDLVATGTKSNPLEDWRDLKHLCLLNLTYDFTPANLVSYDFLLKLFRLSCIRPDFQANLLNRVNPLLSFAFLVSGIS